MKSPLDLAIEQLQLQLAVLSRYQLAAFFAACGERLMPLYEDFSKKSGWGDCNVLRQALDHVWLFLSGAPIPSVAKLLREIEDVTPHGDDFDAPESTFAQDAAICVDAALRASTPSEQIDLRWVEFVIEPAKTAALIEKTGNLDVGSDVEGQFLQNSIVDHAMVKEAIQFCTKTIDFLRDKHSLTDMDLSALRQTARKKW